MRPLPSSPRTARLVLLLVGILGGVFLAACSEDNDRSALLNGEAAFTGRDGKKAKPGATETPEISAKDYFTTKVQPALRGSCGACHGESGPGPTWISPQDLEKSYNLQFQRGYVSMTSAILAKGPHSGGGSLDNEQSSLYLTWVEKEMKERGDKAPDTVLGKLAGCLDVEKFKAIGFENLQTVTRNEDNNPNKETENANECTGCAPTICATCHSADPATGFLMAVGSDIFPEDHTFTKMKSVAPPYMQKYFGLDANGTPLASNAIKAKAELTKNGKAYTHPMYALTPEMEKAIDAFVADAVTKFKAGTCGK